jgi:hypothetical protein
MLEERLLSVDVEVLHAAHGFSEVLDDRPHGDAAREFAADGTTDTVRNDEDVHLRFAEAIENRRVLQIRSAKLH